jgi:hypothetical protein
LETLVVTSNQRRLLGTVAALFIVVVVFTVFVVAPVMVSVVVRVVVVLNAAAISFPVTYIVPFAVVVRSNPALRR